MKFYQNIKDYIFSDQGRRDAGTFIRRRKILKKFSDFFLGHFNNSAYIVSQKGKESLGKLCNVFREMNSGNLLNISRHIISTNVDISVEDKKDKLITHYFTL